MCNEIPTAGRSPRCVYWLLIVLLALGGCSGGAGDWRTASRDSAGIAPQPSETAEAVIQVYAARTVSWRGYFGVHTWISVKASGAEEYTVYDVVRWRLRRGNSAVAGVSGGVPDGYWFGNRPELLADVRGPGVDELIGRIEEVVEHYPYRDTYRLWPGPNSNTFVAFLLRELPELGVDLPPTAIGKDYLGPRLVARAPSGTGYQVSAFGLLGLLAGAREGLEVNVLGLTFGMDPFSPALKLPLAGRLGRARDTAPVRLGGVAEDGTGGLEVRRGHPRSAPAEPHAPPQASAALE